MSHTSPASLLVWAVMSGLLAAFLVFHLWSFDRFRCLKWNSGPASGAFKRIMTYSYIGCLPMISAYSIGFSIIKYKEGFINLPPYGIVPKPYQLWEESSRRAIFPLMLVFSLGWTLEMMTHLEELCFWMFLINSGSSQRHWFHSPYFKVWVVGAVLAFYVPLIAIFTRDNPLQSEGYVFLAGSLGGLSVTLWFIPILWTFPTFLESLRAQGVDMGTIVRLTKFSELNTIRVVFRLLFTVPLLILGADGVRPHKHINESMFATDFLAMVSGFGCAISSAITLVIFFPRSIEGEIAQKDAAIERKRARSGRTSSAGSYYFNHGNMSRSQMGASPIPTGQSGTYLLTSSPVQKSLSMPPESIDSHFDPSRQYDRKERFPSWAEEEEEEPEFVPYNVPPVRPNRRRGQDVELGGVGPGIPPRSREAIPKEVTTRTNKINPMLQNYTSPIMLVSDDGQGKTGEPYLTFDRR